MPERRYFVKGKEKRTHHVHIFQTGNQNINKHLKFKRTNLLKNKT
ncbi:GrpB family protein [Bacillus ndiopicus]